MPEQFHLNLSNIMNDMTGFFDRPLQPIEQDLPSVPKLDSWIELRVTEHVVISGVISRHPKYPTGMRILTSLVESYASDAEGRVYAQTKNSKYELGERIEVRGHEHLVDAIASAHAITTGDKQTIC
ncbi:MAG: hypothetical protein AAF329_20475 [Cyanobacteria bacterium P01_A01_bin.17]